MPKLSQIAASYTWLQTN